MNCWKVSYNIKNGAVFALLPGRGHAPSVISTSSIAISPVKLVPVMPSKIIYKTKIIFIKISNVDHLRGLKWKLSPKRV